MSNSTVISTNYAPNESAADIFIERTNFVGAVLAGWAHGIYCVLYFMCLYYFMHGKTWRKAPWGLIAYVTSLMTCATVFVGANTKWAEEMFIDDRNYPGGPIGFYLLDYTTQMIVLGNVAYLLLNFLSDACILYRCYLIWNFNWVVMILPTLMFLGSTAMSVLTVWQNAQPGAQFFSTISASFALPWSSLTSSLNIILTLMIVARLMYARSKLVAVLGKQHAKLYTSIAAMVVESSSIYGSMSLAFIVCYALGSSFVNVVLPLLSLSMAISPTLILLRVARGRAYSKDTAIATSTGMGHKPTGLSSGQSTKVPMVTITSKQSSTHYEDETSTWQTRKHDEPSSYV